MKWYTNVNILFQKPNSNDTVEDIPLELRTNIDGPISNREKDLTH